MATKDGASDGGSCTPSDGSDSDVSERSGDSDYGSDEEGVDRSSPKLNIQWTGYAKKTPMILFNSETIFQKRVNMRTVGERYHMAYKFGNSECKIVRTILNSHGFHEVHPNSSDYNLIWTGAHLKPFTLRSLSEFQKINHFPRSYELTRKDRLYKNLQRMQQIKGSKNFDIIPASFVLPGEYQDFCTAFLKDKGPWIVKPVASSRGRGIFLVNHPDQIPLDENIIVCRYVSNPLLIDGFKFDVRLYVAVTSYDPLLIYLYEEGLTRFATVKYEKSHRHIRNHCMHLTNYSVNKKNDEYVKNDDADVEDYGNKWSLGAMLRYLRSNGKDTAALMMKIEDVVIKTIMSVELPIATACKMFMPFKGNCFELYGFDILIDDNLKPWVLEVNLSPSLACDSPLDLKIKGNMLCDLFSMSGLICHDPMMRTMTQSRRNLDVASKMAARAKKQRPSSASSLKKGSSGSDGGRDPSAATNKSMAGLNSDEIRVLRRCKEEDGRKGGWVRIFPTPDSWDLYSNFLQFTTTHNLMLHQKLFPDRHKSNTTAAVAGRGSTSAGSRAKSAYIQLANSAGSVKPTVELANAYAQAMLRTKRYERKLGTRRLRNRRKRRTNTRKERRKLAQGVAEDSGDEENENENEDQEENEDDEPPITERNISQRNNPMSQKTTVKDSQKNGVHQSEDVIEIVVESKEAKSDARNSGNNEKKVTGLKSLARYSSEQNCQPDIPRDGVDGSKEQRDSDRDKSPPVPPEPVKKEEPKYNVVELLQKGHTLNKVQARTAFAMYLVRVQQRLMADCNNLNQDDIDGLNEQMDLVLRFLKRAAVNLQQSFKVVVPSRKLPLNDRRRILAKQLGDFVHIYNKETEQLRSRRQLEKKHTHLRRAESLEGLNEDKFDRFVHIASEAELEEVLTTYTKINKSASIFLGSKTGSGGGGETQTPQHVPTTGNSMKHIGATSSAMRPDSSQSKHRKDSVASNEGCSQPPKTVTGWEEVPKAIHSVPTSSSDLRAQPGTQTPTTTTTTTTPGSGGGGGHAHGAAHSRVTYNTNSAASYASAVQIYTQKLSSFRPRSASSTLQKTASEKQSRSRPSSAHMPRQVSATNGNFGSASDLQGNKNVEVSPIASRRPSYSKHFARPNKGGFRIDYRSHKDPYNEKVITEALQRLALRQQARQYSPFNGTSLVPSDTASRPSSASGQREAMDKTWVVHESMVPGTGTLQIDKGGGDRQQERQTYDFNSATGRFVAMEDHITKNRPPSGIAPKRSYSAIDSKTLENKMKKQTNLDLNLQSANATFNSFIEDAGTATWANDLAMAYNTVTGVTPQNYHTPSQSSKQYQILQQQALKQQSKVLLEQSKAKHQAMIAQAHASHKSSSSTTPVGGGAGGKGGGGSKGGVSEAAETAIQMYAPKPPVKPGAKKPSSAYHRVTRRAPEETSLNFQFYSSSKPQMNGGW